MQRDLVARARDGDHDAFASLAASSVGRLYGIARAILADPEQAEDAVQDALVLAWRDLPGLRDVDRFEAWVYRLLVRSCYRRAADARRRYIVEMQVARLDDPDGSAIERPVIDRDRIGRGLRRLPSDQRAVLVLHHHLSYELAEVADILEIPVGTAKSRLFRGMQALRSAIEADDRAGVATEGHPA